MAKSIKLVGRRMQVLFMFGTSGIRGIYGNEITQGLAKRVANIFALDRMVVARDIRKSGLALLQGVSEGAVAAGCDIIDCGIIPTPTLGLATKKYNCRGVMITASHNPPEYNGLKLVENTMEIGKGMEKFVQEQYAKKKWNTSIRNCSKYEDNSIVDEHKTMIMGMVDARMIEKKKPKVIVDPNGAGTAISPSLLSDLGCIVTSINSTFEKFERESEPNEKNLAYLSKMVKATGADFGIAHDGDCDRCVVVDEHGMVLPLDLQLAIMIENEINKAKNKRIVSTVEASLVVRETIEKFGGSIEITPVGSTRVAEKMEETGAYFGGEPAGEYVYSKSVRLPDAPLAAAKFAEIFAIMGSFSKLKNRYRQHFISREKYPAKDKYRTIEAVKNALKNATIDGKIRTDDGIRVDEEDGWFLVRASGTEPIVRLTIEYKAKERLEMRKKEIQELIKRNL